MTGLTRFRDILFWLFLAYRLNTVTCQQRVEVPVGGDALLPCQYNDADPPPETVSIFWRDKDSGVVLDIRQNAPDYSTQEKKFVDRVSSDRSLYSKGNFSIVVKDAQKSDSGQYECNIPRASFKRRVSLNVSGERIQTTSTTGASGGGTAVIPNCLHTLLLLSVIRYCF